MEKKEEIINIPQKRKRSLLRSSAKYFDKNHTKNTIQAKENVERSNDNLEKISREKETKLLNLIVKVIVKSTLEQLYGKESY